MFRPNRVGTPVIHDSLGIGSVALFTLQNPLLASAVANPPMNVINAAPVLDFGHSAIHWFNAVGVAIANVSRAAFGQQFTITPPLNGDTVGVEVIGSMYLNIPNNANMIPRFNKMTAATGTIFANANGADVPTYIAEPYLGNVTDNTVGSRAWYYKQQIVIKDATKVFGTYFHGMEIQITNVGGTITYIDAAFSVRQLNDQQDVGYRDTLR